MEVTNEIIPNEVEVNSENVQPSKNLSDKKNLQTVLKYIEQYKNEHSSKENSQSSQEMSKFVDPNLDKIIKLGPNHQATITQILSNGISNIQNERLESLKLRKVNSASNIKSETYNHCFTEIK